MTVSIDDAKPRPLPRGVLSFLFTDVVDSTALWEQAPNVMDATLVRHDEIIDSSVGRHGGLVLKHKGEGDSTFCVFEKAGAAAAAAVDAQRLLAAEPWDSQTPILVRMGIHTGRSILRGRDYYGQTVNRAARVRAVAEGGQILLSGSASFTIGTELPEAVDLRFVGTEKLKGIERAEEIYELVDTTRPGPSVSNDQPELIPHAPLPAPIAAALPRAFGGRGETLDMIEEVRRAAAAGGSRLVMLHGEPGSGKSTTAAVAAQSAHADGCTVLHGSCDEHLDTAFEPFREVFAALVETAPHRVLAGHISVHGGEIGRLTPKLRARAGELPPVETLDPETTRRLLIGAATDLLGRAATDRPLVVVLDDLQWADPNTLALLEQLTRGDAPITVIGAWRPVSGDDGGDAGVAIERLTDLPNVTDLELAGFDESEILALLEELAGADPLLQGGEIAARLMEETNGNPFFVIELLRHFVETDVLVRVPDVGWTAELADSGAGAPRSIRTVIQERIGRLGPQSGRLLTLAAVAGREFDPALLAAVLDADEGEVLDQIEAAVEASLVREIDIGRFSFAHALVQHTLYDQLGATRCALLHRRLAAGLEELYGHRAVPGMVANHWARAGRAGEEHLGRWARLAAQAAMDELAPEDAIDWYQRALDVVGDDETELLDLLIGLGGAQRWADSVAFRQTFLDAAALADRIDDHDALIRAALANNRGGASAAGQIDDDRVRVLERAIELAGPEDGPNRARLLATLAIELSQGTERERSQAAADQAAACARRLGDEITLLRVLLLTTEATRVPMTLEQRIRDSEGLLDIAERVGDPVLLGVAAIRDVRVKIESAAFGEAEASLEPLDRVSHLDPYVAHNHRVLIAVLQLAAGEVDQALTTADEALALGEGSQGDRMAVYIASKTQILWDKGSIAEMLATIEGIVERYPGVTGFRAWLGIAYCDSGRRDEAVGILDAEVETRFADNPMNPLWLLTLSVFASLAIELDHAPAAEVLDELLRPWRGRANSSVVSMNGLVTETLAGLALVRGDLDTARADVDDALTQAERVAARVSAARSHLTAARLAARLDGPGGRQSAADLARRAAEHAEALGMARVQRQATDLLANLAVLHGGASR